jgi:hypothetical protein
MPGMWVKRLVPVFVVLALVGLLVYQLFGEGNHECRVCVTFMGQRRCGTASAASEEDARREAQSTACSRMAHGVTQAFACPNVQPDEMVCGKPGTTGKEKDKP